MDNKLEADIESHFVNYAVSVKGCKAEKLRIDGVNGWPDRTVLTPRGTFFAEFKRRNGKLRPAQKRTIADLRSLGYLVVIPRAIGEAERVLDEFLSESQRRD